MKKTRLIWGALRFQTGAQDCLFLSLIILLSVVFYVGELGFYSDDWDFLKILSLSDDQSLAGLIRSLFNENPNLCRPVYLIYMAALYWLFGFHPLGYYLVNAVVLMSGVVMFYWVLRELNQSRLLALAIPIVYGLLPHYSTDRLWITCVHASLSMSLYFISLYCDLRILKARPRYLWSWKLVGIASLLGSTLAYELFLPLFFLNLLLVLYHRRQLNAASGTQLGQGKLAVLLGSNLLALILVIVFKSLTTNRIGSSPGIKSLVKAFISSININFAEYGFGLPHVIWRILWSYPNTVVFILAGVLTLVIFSYLYRVASQLKVELPRGSSMLKLVCCGLVVSALSYAFLLRWSTPTGINNRTAIAAAVGVAFVQVGGAGWVSNRLNSGYSRKRFFCLLIALLCTSGFLINNTIASFWIAAYRQQQEILADIRQQFPTFPAGSTLILDGFCPYFGPGIVFETNWDVQGALGIIYRDRTLKGDVVKPNLKVKEDGIFISLYENESHYPYKSLFIYHTGRKITYQLTNADVARQYFSTFNPDYSNGCPKGHAGYEVSIF